jgi:HEPN domain-containing protein
MSDLQTLARGWFRKADSDLNTLRLVVASPGPYDTACYHAQQAVEKYLKGFLIIREQPFPHTHDLEELERLCQEIELLPELDMLDLVELTDYAVGMRYDFEQWPTREEARQAMQTAERVRAAVLARVKTDLHP